MKIALTNSTNNKIYQEDLKHKEETEKFMKNSMNQKNKEERFSREMQQLQSDIENVLRKFS